MTRLYSRVGDFLEASDRLNKMSDELVKAMRSTVYFSHCCDTCIEIHSKRVKSIVIAHATLIAEWSAEVDKLEGLLEEKKKND